MADFDALVLTGGTGRRLGGVDKAAIEVGAQSLLSRALDAVAGAGRVVVVGPERSLPPGVLTTCENPPGGGPVAAIEAGLALVAQPVVVVLACDMPLLGPTHVRRLIDVLHSDGPTPGDSLGSDSPARLDAALYVDEGGRRQPLAAAYRVASLRRTLPMLAPTHGVAVRALICLLTVAEIPADPGMTADCDTWADVARSRTMLEDR